MTYFMKKRGVMIEKAEVEDIKVTIAAMVVGAQQRHAKRSKKVF